MKSRIIKIIISSAALLFLTSGVSFAHDWGRHHHKKHGKAHHKVKRHDHRWGHKHYKPWKHHKKHYRAHSHRHMRRHHREGYFCEDGFYHRYSRHAGHWKSSRRLYRKHYHHSNDYKRHHRRKNNRDSVVYKVALKDSDIVFKIVAKDR